MEQAEEARFGFGRNWRRYVDKAFSQERVDAAKQHLLDFLGRENLEGLHFLDIGCGSGIHSLAAWQAGAARVTAFDYDPDSVATARMLHARAGSPANWSIQQGSVLDKGFMETLPEADIVYSWGVLHHTGDQWTAIRNAAGRVPAGGLFYIALYTSDAFVDPPPEFWLDVKKRYLAAGWWGQRRLELWYVWRFGLSGSLNWLPRLVRQIREHRRVRGMSYYTDVRDWLGGWPMEFSSIADVKRFAAEDLRLELVRIADGHANTEYLFRRPA